jgi:deoxyribonuclease (pyrimidine dimer)
MTRINIIPIEKLSDELLLNALGEETRILQGVVSRLEKNKSFNDIPNNFKLGAGHVKFFYNKCEYIFERYLLMRAEYMLRYGKPYSFDHLYLNERRKDFIKERAPNLYNDFKPSKMEERLVLDRIYERSQGYTKTHHYKGKEIKDWKGFLYGTSF